MKNIRFYIGPMTQNVIDSVIEFAEENDVKFGFIPSRRQIDWTGGYVGYNTLEFIKYVNSKTNKILICRDHAGLSQGLENCNAFEDSLSMKCDAAWNIDIIHIDPWKKFSKPDQFELAVRETINNILLINQMNYLIKFEVGTEEAIRHLNNWEFFNFLDILKSELGDIFKKIKYAVIQSGTKLQETKNIGHFDIERLQKMCEICQEFGVLSKEHNGDYLTDEEIKIRFDNGLNAINIAPEFGVFETKILIKDISNKKFNKIYNICLNGGNWKKWVDLKCFDPKKEKRKLIEICGHYHNKEIKKIVNMDDLTIIKEIKNRLQQLNSL